MKILAIETSTDFGTCALLQDGVIDQRICPPGRPHSETLLPLVREMMADSGIGFAQLDALAFGAEARHFVDEGDSGGLRLGERAVEVINVEADVVDARAFPVQKLQAARVQAAISGLESFPGLLVQVAESPI